MKVPLPRLHAVTDERIARRPDLERVAADLAAAGGPDLAFHARGHTLTGLEHYELALRLAVRPSGRLFINDRLDIALAAGVAGVHLGQDSLPVDTARRLEPTWWIGKSVHDLDEARAAQAEGADYLFLGPVYLTATHADRAPVGIGVLREVVQLGLPVVAIGGVTVERVPEIRGAGAYGIAAIRELWDAPEPAAQVRRMLKELTP